VKLLLDENLSRKLVVRLAELYPDSAHVADFDLLAHPDQRFGPSPSRKGSSS
jgi:predicted nuclease of predicted toxin-antitoxin system